jgi:CubicO group peptidase (beta-lactamase class C family)
LADIDASTPLTADTRFDIDGVANQFIATAILLLVQDGKLALSDPLSAHLPNLAAWADRVSIDQLLHQTSGVPEVWARLEHDAFPSDQLATQADALHALGNVRELNFEPGAVIEYRDANYVLLAEVVNAVSGQTLPDFLRERVFAPSNLDVVFRSEARGDVAVGYDEILGRLEPAHYHGSLLAGPGFAMTTPSELVRWADQYRTGAVGGPQLLDAVARNARPISSAPDASDYGAGMYLRAGGSIEHDGWPPGGRRYFSVSPDRHTAVAFSCNEGYLPDKVEKLIVGPRTIWFGMP